jgi:uncharacterized protein (DUF885 family)
MMRRLLLFLLLPCCFAAAQTPNAATGALHALFERTWDYEMEQHPTHASSLGDRRWNDRWEDDSLAAIAARHEHNQQVLRELAAIPRDQLAANDQISYDLFKYQYSLRVEAYPFHEWLIVLNQRGGIQTEDELGDALRFANVKDYEDWIARLRSFPGSMDQTIALMRQGIKERILLPKVVMQRVSGQIEKQIVSDPEASPFFKPFKRFPREIAQTDRDRLSAAAREAIASQIVPSFRKFHEFFDKEYLPACFDQVGIWQIPRGDQFYALAVRRSTTTNLTPQQVHEIGLKEVARIRGEMEKIKQQVGFTGTMPEFFQFLRTDPRFFYKTPEELFNAYKVVAKTVDPNLVKVFRVLPRTPYGVEPIPDIAAPDTTAAYYRQLSADGSRAGTYFVNLYKPESRPKWEMMALTLHESVPGHHLQIALAYENGDQPKFRRYGGYDAFVEGWGLYAESLGDDMNLYTDPYSKFGQLTYDMWRAVRLVVDTGIHAMHWDRQRAINYFMENAPKAELDIVNEIDRYIAWPGQALGYKIGQLKFKELRERARQQLGPRFDVKEYHEVVLRNGPLPLQVLEQNVDAWLAQKPKSASGEGAAQ